MISNLEPHPGFIPATMAEAHSAPGTRRDEHVHPVLNGERMVVRVHELDRAATHHLLRIPAKNLRSRLVDPCDEAKLVLNDRGEPGRGCGSFAGLQAGAVRYIGGDKYGQHDAVGLSEVKPVKR